jgi:hypothetical protein
VAPPAAAAWPAVEGGAAAPPLAAGRPKPGEVLLDGTGARARKGAAGEERGAPRAPGRPRGGHSTRARTARVRAGRPPGLAPIPGRAPEPRAGPGGSSTAHLDQAAPRRRRKVEDYRARPGERRAVATRCGETAAGVGGGLCPAAASSWSSNGP